MRQGDACCILNGLAIVLQSLARVLVFLLQRLSVRFILRRSLLQIGHLLLGDLTHGRFLLMTGKAGHQCRSLLLDGRLQFLHAGLQLRILILYSLQGRHVLGPLRIGIEANSRNSLLGLPLQPLHQVP